MKDLLSPEARELLTRKAAQRGHNFTITQTLGNRFALAELFTAGLVAWSTGDIYHVTHRGMNVRAAVTA
jgi:hypothetical protein